MPAAHASCKQRRSCSECEKTYAAKFGAHLEADRPQAAAAQAMHQNPQMSSCGSSCCSDRKCQSCAAHGVTTAHSAPLCGSCLDRAHLRQPHFCCKRPYKQVQNSPKTILRVNVLIFSSVCRLKVSKLVQGCSQVKRLLKEGSTVATFCPPSLECEFVGACCASTSVPSLLP